MCTKSSLTETTVLTQSTKTGYNRFLTGQSKRCDTGACYAGMTVYTEINDPRKRTACNLLHLKCNL